MDESAINFWRMPCCCPWEWLSCARSKVKQAGFVSESWIWSMFVSLLSQRNMLVLECSVLVTERKWWWASRLLLSGIKGELHTCSSQDSLACLRFVKCCLSLAWTQLLLSLYGYEVWSISFACESWFTQVWMFRVCRLWPCYYVLMYWPGARTMKVQ